MILTQKRHRILYYRMYKTFFEIEGLFIILPTNMIVLSLYTVLITQRETVEKIYAVNQYLTEDRLKEAFNKKLLSKHKEQYNSYKNLSMQKLSLFLILLKQIYRHWKLNIPNILQ